MKIDRSAACFSLVLLNNCRSLNYLDVHKNNNLNTVFVIHYTKDIQTESEIHFQPHHIFYIFCFLQEF